MKSGKIYSRAKVILHGSHRQLPEGVVKNRLDENENLQISIRIRRKKSLEKALKELIQYGKTYTREEYEQEFGASKRDMKRVEDFIFENDLSVVRGDLARRTLVVCGTAGRLCKAFGVTLDYYTTADGKTFRGREGSIYVPKYLEGIIEGIFGLDDRIQTIPASGAAKTARRRMKPAPSARFYATELINFYDFPAGNGKGECIGLIQLGGGFNWKDIQKYFTRLKLPIPEVKSISIDGGLNQPGLNDDHDKEVTMDIQIAGTIAPKASIVVYFAPNTSDGLLKAITQVIHDKENNPSLISISWGNPEKKWTDQSMHNINEAFKAAALLGITVCAASGDHGATNDDNDQLAHVYFPASSPYVLACGGTQIDSKNKKEYEEVVWNGVSNSSGGGVSNFFPLPRYQKQAKIPSSVNPNSRKGRGIPDVSGIAEGRYKILIKGKIDINGGTSAVAPLMAGLFARINSSKREPIGFINPRIYQHPSVFRDITKGNNSKNATRRGYNAGIGWDACTGLGVADGKKLASIFPRKR